MLTIDHFVFGASDLATGRKWMEDALGLPPVGAGKHTRMSTHNALWRLGTAYLEVIAADPNAAEPAHPRWYGLDDAATKARISEAPKLLTWVVATPDIEATRTTSPIDPGPALQFSRDDLHWQLTVPATGTPHHGGAFPALIHWPEGVKSPAKTLEDQGLAIAEFRVFGTDILKAALADLGALPLASAFEQADHPALSLTVNSPETGTVHLA